MTRLSDADYLLLVVGMGAVTYLPRLLPLALLSRRQLPPWLAGWLELIPPAILAALLAPTLFTDAVPRQLHLGKPELLAAVPTLLFALRTRSLAGTVVVGMAFFWLIGKLPG
jgi:branched-subunit amino acid transport protein